MKAQRSSKPRPAPITPALCGCLGTALALAVLPALGQSAASPPQLFISSSFTASETYTDTQRDSGFSGGEFVTVLTPAVRISGRVGPITGSFDYSLSALYYSENSQANRVASNAQNGLNTAFTLTPIDNFAFVDVRASVGQQQISPFGQQSVSNNISQANPNRTEVSTLSVSPYLRGAFDGVMRYEARVEAVRTDARNSNASDSSSTTASLTLASPSSGAVLGWSLAATNQRVDFRAGRKTDSDRLTATLTARPLYDLQLSLSGGRESTDVGSASGRRSNNTWGWGARWTPTDRTNISYLNDRRYFGNSHNIAFEHRMPRTVWRYTDIRDTTGGEPNGVGRPVTLYELYFAQFASLQPDPLLREQLVLSYLRGIGANPSDTVGGGLLTTAVTLQRRQDLSVALQGLRTNLSLQAFSTQSRVLDAGALGPGNEPVTQRGYNGNLSYRLTPTSSLSLNGAQQKTLSTATRRGNDLKSVSLNLTSQASRTASTSLSARYAVFNSDTNAYRDTSIAASVRFQF